MTTLTASLLLQPGARHVEARALGLRQLFARMADAARAAHDRRAMSGLSEHMLRDLGLTRGDLDVLDL